MDQQDIIADIERRATAAGVSISALCTEAGVHPTTFSRWKLSEKNPEPIGATIKTLSALTVELERLEAREDADPPFPAADSDKQAAA